MDDKGEYEARRQAEHYSILVSAVNTIWPGVDIFGVSGNHDWCKYGVDGVKGFDDPCGQTYEWRGLKVHGFRGVPEFGGNWNDEYSERALEILCSHVPVDTDILITHTPPVGILDDAHDAKCLVCGKTVGHNGLCNEIHESSMWLQDGKESQPIVRPLNIGSFAVRDLVERLPNLKAHFFGHVHECGGRVEVRGNTAFSNASCTLNRVVL